MRNNESRNDLEDKVQASLRGIYTDLKKRIIFPTTVRNLENLYYSKLSQEIKMNLHRSLPQTINLSSKELELSFENQILDALKFLNYYKLKKLITESITTFLDKLDLQADFEVEPFQNLIKDNIDHNDKIIVEVVGRINHASTANPDIDFAKLNKKLPEVYSSLIVYQQMLYAKYEMSDLYSDTNGRVKEETEAMIYNHAKLKYPRVLKQPCETIEGLVATCIKEFEERFETNLQEEYEKKFQIKTFIDTYSNTTKYLTKIFKEHATNQLGEVPCGVLISPYLKQINSKIYNSVIMDKILNFNDEKFSLYENLIIEQIMIIFESLNFSKRRGFTHLFQTEKLGGDSNKVFSLFRIVFLTDYAEGSFYTHEQCFKYLENFYAKYIDHLETDDSNICQLLENIETEEDFAENQPLIKKSLEAEKKAWDETTQNFENLYAMICLFLAFNQSPEGAYNRDYTATKKYMLKCIFRNLKNGKSQFSNFRILNMIERCASNYINKKCNSDSHHNSPVLSPMSCSTRTYKKKRNSIFSSETASAWEEKKQQDFRLIFQEQLYSSDIRPDLKRPLEFSLDKISNSSVTSKTVVICVGDLWLGDKNVEEWDPIIKKNPHSEVFTLKWNSNGMSNLFDICVKQLTEFSRASKGVLFGLVFPHISPVLLGYAAYCAYKDLKRASWDETWNEACVTGVYLAHILNLAYNKKDFVVNLCGFGFGSLVVMNCIWELQRLERFDIVYDVLLIGGVVNVASFNKTSIGPAYHQIINCYCKTDYLLKVWHKAADYKLNSIGTEPIFSLDGQIRNIDVSTEVNGHMDYKTSLSNIIKNIDFNEDFNYMLQK